MRTISDTAPVKGVCGVIVAMSSMAKDTLVVKPPFNISNEMLDIFEILITKTFQKIES